jgi:hypothetical protein
MARPAILLFLPLAATGVGSVVQRGFYAASAGMFQVEK